MRADKEYPMPTTTQSRRGKTNTLTVRRLSDECVSTLKRAAKANNRSMESEVRSILEEFTAEWIIQCELKHANFFSEVRRFMEEEGIEGFDESEFMLPERGIDDGRPTVEFDAA